MYCCAYTGGIFRWTGSTLDQVHDDDISVWELGGGELVCATGVQPGIYTYDGTSWTITHSI